MSRPARDIGRTLSLRPPQQEALDLLVRLVDEAGVLDDAALGAKLAAAQAIVPELEDFERDFPNLCFALATGVGKTRLMGAAIAWLHRTRKVRHFLVLAPGGTIYEQLVGAFTAGHKRYVFPGIAEFATNPPLVVTGENWDDGRVVAEQLRADQQAFGFAGDRVIIYVFNIQKLATRNAEGRKTRTFRETLGTSLFGHLTAQKDLVVLMDEAHRYRADVANQTLEDLTPCLGIEVTATPQVQKGAKAVTFRNVAYHYPLARALEDGFVKVPVVAARADLNPKNLDADVLERLKLEDGMKFHELRKAELRTYADATGAPWVKPFALVICSDTTHASEIETKLQEDAFFGGRYRDKVVRLDSTTKNDDDVARLMAEVERLENPVEIVVHVNMLREGWDVTNLYTVIPLRTASSRTLVEQAIGRGLRLPFGKRVGARGKPYDPDSNPWHALDRLTIIAHEHFEQIVNEANKESSLLRQAELVRYRDEDLAAEAEIVRRPSSAVEAVVLALTDTVEPALHRAQAEGLSSSWQAVMATGASPLAGPAAAASTGAATPGQVQQVTTRIAMDTTAALRRVARAANLRSASELHDPKVRATIVARAAAALQGAQAALPGLDMAAVVEQTLDAILTAWTAKAIDVPEIQVVAQGRRTAHHDFDYRVPSGVFEPIADQIKLQDLDRAGAVSFLRAGIDPGETRLEDYVIGWIIDEPAIDYAAETALFQKLAMQLVAVLREQRTLASPDADEATIDAAVRNVLLFHRDQLRTDLLGQLRTHRYETADHFDVIAREKFVALDETMAPPAASVVALATTPVHKASVKTTWYGPLQKACQPVARFDSDTERKFALLLEQDPTVLRWLRPGSGKFPPISYGPDQASRYEPDFVVETKDGKFLIETKARKDMEQADVRAKNEAARLWCERASAWEATLPSGGKPWTFAILADDEVVATATIGGLLAKAAARGAQ